MLQLFFSLVRKVRKIRRLTGQERLRRVGRRRRPPWGMGGACATGGRVGVSMVGMFFREEVVVCVAENTFSRNTYWQTKILAECSAGR